MTVMATPKKKPWSKVLLRLREAKGLTQEAAARFLEVSISTYRNWEQGRTSPPLFARKLVEKALREPTTD